MSSPATFISALTDSVVQGRGIFHNKEKSFLTWVNEEDQLRIISMQKGGDVKQVFDRLARGIKAVEDSVKKESGQDFMKDAKYGYIHSCPTNLGTGKTIPVLVTAENCVERSITMQISPLLVFLLIYCST